MSVVLPQLLRLGEWAAWAGWLAALFAVAGWIVLFGSGGQSAKPRPWVLDHPRVARFMTYRTSWNSVTGLPLTMLLLVSGYFLIVYTTGILAAPTHGEVVRFDRHVAAALAASRTPWLVDVFGVVTAFGNWAVVFTLAAAVSILLWLRGRSNCVAGLWIAIAGNQVTVTLLKALFRRARPELAFFTEASYSFPSGHSAISAAFFGLLVHVVIRERIFPSGPSVLTGGVAIVLVCFSRLILGEHYLTDVLSGALVGSFWAVIGIWCMDRLATLRTDPPATLLRQAVQVAVVVVAVVALWFVAANYRQTLVVQPPAVVSP